MKRIQIASDIHSEFYNRANWDELLATFDGEADILVLAGDIVPLRFVDQVRDILNDFCSKYKNVVYVAGNHEYYGTDAISAAGVLGAVSNEIYNFTWLKNTAQVVDGVQFFGGTLWFRNLVDNWKWKQNLNDFHYIRRFEPWVYHQVELFKDGFLEHVNEQTIVVSHHLPTFASVAPKYAGDGMQGLNAFFVNEMDQFINHRNPRLWIHGHTHTPCDHVVGRTRIICNPYGYPHELEVSPKPIILEV